MTSSLTEKTLYTAVGQVIDTLRAAESGR